MAQPPQPPPEEGETPGCVVKEIEKQLYKTLKDVFKYDSYKSLVQKRAVEAVSRSSHDVFIHMPTGAGKSLCYQLPAIIASEKRGLTIVVSPLIALMVNQMEQMMALGIPTSTINSKMRVADREKVTKDLTSNSPKTKLLYITPEFANTTTFRSIMDHLYKSNNVARIAVDEAHCVSQWGQSFRPDYLQLAKLRERYMSIPWVALTATASSQVMDDILTLLKLSPPVAIFKTSCFRSNLFYDVVYKETMDDPYSDLAEFGQSALKEQGCGIVYCRTRDGCEELANRLTKLGLPALPYHAGINTNARKETQSSWMEGKVPVIAATVSFGMGIDKSNVRFVAHWCVSQSVAGYYQESGRAGRDGKSSKCRIYYSRKDRDTILFLLKKDETTLKSNIAKSKVAATIKSFNTMIKYCEESVCRHYVLAREFGDDMPDCKKYCDVCRSPKAVEQKLSAFKGLALGSTMKYPKDSHGSGDLYGGGRLGVKQEFGDYEERDGANQEKDAAIALSNLISEEFNKRKGSKEKTEKYSRSSSSKVIQPSVRKIPEVSVPMRENYFDKLLEEIKYHLKACSSNKRCPSFNEKDLKQCASEFEWQCFSSKKNIHMYRREIVNLTKSLREASRQVEIHPLISKFVPGQNLSCKSNSGGKERLHTIVDYFSKKSNSERFENTNLSSSQSGCDSHKTGHGSDVSQGEFHKKARSRSSDARYEGSDKNKSSLNLDSDSDHSEKCIPKKRTRMSESSKSSIEEKKPLMKYFFESVGCPVEESVIPPLSLEVDNSVQNCKVASPTSKSQASANETKSSVSPQKKRRRKSSDLFSDRSGSTERSKPKNDHAKTTTQIRNDNLKKAADLVRKHLNPEYKSKRISKDFFKIVCRSISHRLVESDAVNDTAAKFEVEKLLQSNGSLHVNQ